MLQITPNGPYGKDHHPSMPITVDELLADLTPCLELGARGVHLHPRDEQGRESLEPGCVNKTARKVRGLADACGLDIEISVTTGAWIAPDLGARVAMIADWEGVDCATVNLSEDGFPDVMAALLKAGIGIDVGLWDISELARLADSGFARLATRISIELDPHEEHSRSDDPLALADEINAALDELAPGTPRLTHGAGAWTWPLVRDAYRRSHDTRVGFEDSTRLPDGSVARCNADLVLAALASEREAAE